MVIPRRFCRHAGTRKLLLCTQKRRVPAPSPCVRWSPSDRRWSSLQAPSRGFHGNRLPVARERVLYPRCDQHRGPLRGASMAAGLSVEGRAYVEWPDVLGGPAERYIHGRGGPAERMNLDAPPSGRLGGGGGHWRRGTARNRAGRLTARQDSSSDDDEGDVSSCGEAAGPSPRWAHT